MPAEKHEQISSACVFLPVCNTNYWEYRGGFHGSTSPHLPRPLIILLTWQPIASFPILCPALLWGTVRCDEGLSGKLPTTEKRKSPSGAHKYFSIIRTQLAACWTLCCTSRPETSM